MVRRVAVVGVSPGEICGVHDHARLLAGGLGAEGVECSMHWLVRERSGLQAEREEMAAFAQRLREELPRSKADMVLLHYSVFAFAHRGLPLFVPSLLGAVRGAGLPVVTVLHEAVYPWNVGGARGKLWAASQRVALIDLVRLSGALLVTADFRADWLRSRLWLPRRPVAVAPVFSNLPAPRRVAPGERDGETVGLFGYSYEGTNHELVLDALAHLHRRGRPARLRLLGAPGPDSDAARSWRQGAAARGLEGSLSFSGRLGEQELSDELARCDVLLCIAALGPTSRKGSLAGSLASGRPVLALDGPRTWRELVEADALRLAAQSPQALAAGLGELLGDAGLQEELGARGRAFALERMGVGRTAEAVIELAGRLGV
jgi:glycosyltransferase involved in cell wall biosynthesis